MYSIKKSTVILALLLGGFQYPTSANVPTTISVDSLESESPHILVADQPEQPEDKEPQPIIILAPVGPCKGWPICQ